jgi:hypothetical protein
MMVKKYSLMGLMGISQKTPLQEGRWLEMLNIITLVE